MVTFSRALAALGVLSLGLASNQAHAVGAPAGTDIDNTAVVTYSVGTVTATTTSNPTTVRVAEILDVVVTLQTPDVPVVPGATQQEMLYRVTNAGNGPEAFLLTMTSAIGGDEQRVSDVSTDYSNVTFKHLLLPIYAGAYRFNNKVFQIVVNGRTGEVQGERPYSWLKITAFVLAILAAILFIVMIVSVFKK